MTKLPKEFDPEGARTAWLHHGLGELDLWLLYMDQKLTRIRDDAEQGRRHLLEQAELVFIYSAFFNRLAQISKKDPENLDIATRLVPWLAGKTGWPENTAKAFWYCIRNPIIHVGRAWEGADYGEISNDGAVLKAGFRPNVLDEKPATEMPEPHGSWMVHG